MGEINWNKNHDTMFNLFNNSGGFMKFLVIVCFSTFQDQVLRKDRD
jgi:hypothetical protein